MLHMMRAVITPCSSNIHEGREFYEEEKNVFIPIMIVMKSFCRLEWINLLIVLFLLRKRCQLFYFLRLVVRLSGCN